jgi:hypothetical protein
VLHLSFLVNRAPAHILEAHGSLAPSRLAMARRINDLGLLEQVASNGGRVEDVAKTLWSDLTALACEQDGESAGITGGSLD